MGTEPAPQIPAIADTECAGQTECGSPLRQLDRLRRINNRLTAELKEIASKNDIAETGEVASLSPDQQEGDRISDVISPPAPETERNEGSAPVFETDEERIKYFAGRTKWVDAKAANPSLTPVDHIRETYPDRHLGLLRNDLFDPRIDPRLYRALYSWLNYKNADGSRNQLPDDFGLPVKKAWNDAQLKKKGVPTGADVFKAMRRGDPNSREIGRLYAAARRRGLTP